MLLQLISGVTVDQGSLEEFQTPFTQATAVALGVDADAVVITAVDLVTVRRNLRDRDASVHRKLGSTSTVKISFTVATSATATSVTTSLRNAAPTVTNALNVVGAIEGFVAEVGAPVIDLSTSAPTDSPIEETDDGEGETENLDDAKEDDTPSPAPVDEVTEAPTPAPVNTEAPTPAPVNTEAPTPAPVIEPTPGPGNTEAPTPAPVIEPTPAPVNTEAPTPTPVIEPTPTPVIEPVDEGTEGPTPAGVDEVIEVARGRRTYV